jgi:hypothetical protein
MTNLRTQFQRRLLLVIGVFLIISIPAGFGLFKAVEKARTSAQRTNSL